MHSYHPDIVAANQAAKRRAANDDKKRTYQEALTVVCAAIVLGIAAIATGIARVPGF
jgi:hypothetical protein